jgi:hypothetical protein
MLEKTKGRMTSGAPRLIDTYALGSTYRESTKGLLFDLNTSDLVLMCMEPPSIHRILPSVSSTLANPSCRDALALYCLLKTASANMSSTGPHFGKTVQTTLSPHLSGYIRSEQLANRLYEIFGRNIEVEVSIKSLSELSLGTKVQITEFAVPARPIYFPSSETGRRGRLSLP